MSRSLLAPLGVLGRELAGPSHPRGCGFGVVSELLRHPGGAAARTEPVHSGPDRPSDHVRGRAVGWLQRGDEQRFAPGVASWPPYRLEWWLAMHVASSPSVVWPRPRLLRAGGLARVERSCGSDRFQHLAGRGEQAIASLV